MTHNATRSLDGRTVIVTGAGQGIGRACAILAAREGANVLVNDVGRALSGADEAQTTPADDVATEIVCFGGKAVADYGDVSSLEAVQKMVQTTFDAFGSLHAVLNPAGILRDGMIHKMSPQNFDAVVQTHLRGAFNVVRATIEHFRSQQDGAYVHFTSTSGLIGNVGQANYAAAKMGVVGLSRIVAIEGASKQVRSNVLAPFAWTRMTSAIPVTDASSAERVERMRLGMRSEQVATAALALIAPQISANGQIFCVRGNELILFSQPRPAQAISRPDDWTIHELVAKGLPSLAHSFTPLEVSGNIFDYEPL